MRPTSERVATPARSPFSSGHEGSRGRHVDGPDIRRGPWNEALPRLVASEPNVNDDKKRRRRVAVADRPSLPPHALEGGGEPSRLRRGTWRVQSLSPKQLFAIRLDAD